MGSRRMLSVSVLMGQPVRNPEGEDLGSLEDFVLDADTGRLMYAIVSPGEFLGLGNRLFVVPWPALMPDRDKRQFILDLDRATLAEAPAFDKESWPDMDDAHWVDEVHRFYGLEPPSGASAVETPSRGKVGAS